jgi:hypothetical protein
MNPRHREAVIQALRAGVVPSVGQHLIQVGRIRELEALISDVERVAAGGSSFRVIVGEYGAGKTFFLNQVRNIALERKLVTAHADLNPDRRLQSSSGQARSLFAELMKNLSTRAKAEGGALSAVVEKFVTTALEEAKKVGETPENVIANKCAQLTEMVNGYDFANVIAAYWRGYNEGNEQLKLNAVRWLRGEFRTITEAREALDVRNIVNDAHFYDQLKLMAAFVRLAGYSGLLVNLDEMVNLYKLPNTQARNANYEQLLRILNDVLQGAVKGLGFVFGCTPQTLMDTRRGIYSYAALQSRLAENTFASKHEVDYKHPVLSLSALSQEHFYMLLERIRDVYASGDASRHLIPNEGIQAFMAHCAKKIGADYFNTPRTTITAFVNLLSMLEQYPDVPWQSRVEEVKVVKDTGGVAELALESTSTDDEGDEFEQLKL